MRWWRVHPAVVLVISAGVVLVVGVLLGLGAFRSQREHADDVIAFGDPDAADALGVDAHVVAIHPGEQDMVVRLTFRPLGALASDNQVTPSRDLLVLVSTATGKSELRFEAGSVMNPAELTVQLKGGAELDYPFDRYDADLIVYAQEPGGPPIPVRGALSPGLTGFVMHGSTARFLGQPIERLRLERVGSTVFFAVFLMVVMWLLALSGLAVAISLATRRKRWESTLATFLGTMLFAFPAMRGALPGAPPIGARFDYLSFYWAEALVVIALLVAVSSWVIVGPKGERAGAQL